MKYDTRDKLHEYTTQAGWHINQCEDQSHNDDPGGCYAHCEQAIEQLRAIMKLMVDEEGYKP